MDNTELKKLILDLIQNDAEFKFQVQKALNIDDLETEIESLKESLNK